jgi:hypothetical protein
MTQDVQYIHHLVQCINQALYNLLYNRNIVMYTCILTAKLTISSPKLYVLSHHAPYSIPPLPIWGGGVGCPKIGKNSNFLHLHSIAGGPLVPQLL